MCPVQKKLQKLCKSYNAEVPVQHASDVSIKADHKRPVPKLHDGSLVDSIRLLPWKMPNPLRSLISQCSMLLRLFPFLYSKLLVSPWFCSRTHRWPKFMKTPKLMGKNSKNMTLGLQCHASLAYEATEGDQMLTSLQPLRFLQTRYGFMWWDG